MYPCKNVTYIEEHRIFLTPVHELPPGVSYSCQGIPVNNQKSPTCFQNKPLDDAAPSGAPSPYVKYSPLQNLSWILHPLSVWGQQ